MDTRPSAMPPLPRLESDHLPARGSVIGQSQAGASVEPSVDLLQLEQEPFHTAWQSLQSWGRKSYRGDFSITQHDGKIFDPGDEMQPNALMLKWYRPLLRHTDSVTNWLLVYCLHRQLSRPKDLKFRVTIPRDVTKIQTGLWKMYCILCYVI